MGKGRADEFDEMMAQVKLPNRQAEQDRAMGLCTEYKFPGRPEENGRTPIHTIQVTDRLLPHNKYVMAKPMNPAEKMSQQEWSTLWLHSLHLIQMGQAYEGEILQHCLKCIEPVEEAHNEANDKG